MKASYLSTVKIRPIALRACCAIAFVMSLCACQGEKFLKRKGLVERNATIEIAANAKDSIVLNYTGCSGFFIRKGDNVVLLDPYFSYRPLFRFRMMAVSHIRQPLSDDIDSTFYHSIGSTKDESGIIDALLVGHAHVDHLGDVPYLYESGHINKGTRIYASTTAGHYLRAHDKGLEDNIVENIESSASSWLSVGKWIPINKNIRVMPIVSEHGPHARVLGMNMSFVSGKHEMKDTKRWHPLRYGTGQTLSYLIDFLNDDGTINFRIYHSSAAANSPNGFPPASVLAEHKVDIQILCAASFNQVKRYPREIVRYVNPRHIVLSHWEEFVVSSHAGIKAHPRANFIYSYRKFFRRFNHLRHDLNDRTDTIKYTFPNVDTKMTFYY